ncbi:MAG: hypothetical protein RL081_455 [Pseudomonadota bacterium]
MLTWDDEVKPSTPTNLARTATVNAPLVQESSSSLNLRTLDDGAIVPSASNTNVSPAAAPRRVRAADKRIINGQTDVNQLVPFKYMGVGEVPRYLRQPLDAAGSQYDPRHRALERPQRSDRR